MGRGQASAPTTLLGGHADRHGSECKGNSPANAMSSLTRIALLRQQIDPFHAGKPGEIGIAGMDFAVRQQRMGGELGGGPCVRKKIESDRQLLRRAS